MIVYGSDRSRSVLLRVCPCRVLYLLAVGTQHAYIFAMCGVYKRVA
jgi:hypothetical protein